MLGSMGFLYIAYIIYSEFDMYKEALGHSGLYLAVVDRTLRGGQPAGEGRYGRQTKIVVDYPRRLCYIGDRAALRPGILV